MPMRIHMVFGETSILVPCGDGKLTVAELVEKSVVKFKKFIAKVCYHSYHQAVFVVEIEPLAQGRCLLVVYFNGLAGSTVHTLLY